jgi:2-hydroxychromene-2-carboxylate isomerase
VRRADWYFDFVSPYAYFASLRLQELGEALDIHYQPVLLAELLTRCGQKGPAEIPAKRLWTYRSCTWWAADRGIPFRFPAAHPFNPLPFLRLAIAAKGEARAVRTIFDALWTTGADPADPTVLTALARSVGVEPAVLSEPGVKEALRSQTEQAANRGVFGVPTLIVDGQLFWGADAIDFIKAYLADPTLIVTDEMKRLGTLPVGATRKSG